MKRLISIGLVMALGVFGLCSCSTTTPTPTTVPTETTESIITSETTLEIEPTIEALETYTLVGKELGDYGKVITLNATTDMPVDKYLYKLPAGQYRVHITSEYPSSLFVVKDDITIEEGNNDYPETLNYVQKDEYNYNSCFYLMGTNGNDMNGNAVAEVVFTLEEDESISIPEVEEGKVYIFELIQPSTSSSEVAVIDGQ